MSDLKIFSETIPLNNKRVIVRLDLNVPVENSKFNDYTRTNEKIRNKTF